MATKRNLQKVVKLQKIARIKSPKVTKQQKQVKRTTYSKTKILAIKTKESTTFDLNVNFFSALEGVYSSY